MNPPYFKDSLDRQPHQCTNDDIDMLETIIHHYFNSLSTQKIDHLLENFYQESKKVDNKKMKKFFNYELKYPTYVEGLDYIFNNTV